ISFGKHHLSVVRPTHQEYVWRVGLGYDRQRGRHHDEADLQHRLSLHPRRLYTAIRSAGRNVLVAAQPAEQLGSVVHRVPRYVHDDERADVLDHVLRPAWQSDRNGHAREPAAEWYSVLRPNDRHAADSRR